MAAKLIIVGNVGQDPEMRYTPTGDAVVNFSIATNRQWNDSEGNKKKETTWFRISFWRGAAETINQYVRKGTPLYIEGRLRAEPEVYERKDGSWATSYEVTGDRFEFISGTGNGEQRESAPSHEDPDDIPF